MHNKRRVTLEDIGRKLGLSARSISQALAVDNRGTARISPETREKVQKMAREMGYRHDLAAKSLRTGKTGMLGVLNFEFYGQLSSQRLHFAVEAVKKLGVTPLVYHANSTSEEACEQAGDAMLDAKADGVFVIAPSTVFGQQLIDRLLRAGVSVVTLGTPNLKGVGKYVADKKAGFFDLTNHLIEEGNKTITLLCRDISGERDRRLLQWRPLAIIEGFQQAVDKARDEGRDVRAEISSLPLGIGGPDVGPYEEIHAHYVPGYLGMWRIIQSGRIPDALMCQVDAWALGALRACAEAGIKVPEEMAITGCEDDPIGAVGLLPLTTVAQPLEELSSLAAKELLGLVRGEREPEDFLCLRPCRPVIRQSSVRRKLPSPFLSSGPPV